MEEDNINIKDITADDIAELLRNTGLNEVQPVFETPKNEDQMLTDTPDSVPNNAPSSATLPRTGDTKDEKQKTAPKHDFIMIDSYYGTIFYKYETINILSNTMQSNENNLGDQENRKKKKKVVKRKSTPRSGRARFIHKNIRI